MHPERTFYFFPLGWHCYIFFMMLKCHFFLIILWRYDICVVDVETKMKANVWMNIIWAFLTTMGVYHLFHLVNEQKQGWLGCYDSPFQRFDPLTPIQAHWRRFTSQGQSTHAVSFTGSTHKRCAVGSIALQVTCLQGTGRPAAINTFFCTSICWLWKCNVTPHCVFAPYNEWMFASEDGWQ